MPEAVRDVDDIVYCPEFIPYYVGVAQEFSLTPCETLLYGFIRFFTSSGSRFFFSSKKLGEMFNFSEGSINNAMNTLQQKEIIKTVRSVKAGGGTRRHVTWVYIPTSLKNEVEEDTSLKNEVDESSTSLKNELLNINNNINNINNNKIYISKDIYTKEELEKHVSDKDALQCFEDFNEREKKHWAETKVPVKLQESVLKIVHRYKAKIHGRNEYNALAGRNILKLLQKDNYDFDLIVRNMQCVEGNSWWSEKAKQWPMDSFFRNGEKSNYKFSGYSSLKRDKKSVWQERKEKSADLWSRVMKVWIRENYPQYDINSIPTEIENHFYSLYDNNELDESILDRIDTSLV